MDRQFVLAAAIGVMGHAETDLESEVGNSPNPIGIATIHAND